MNTETQGLRDFMFSRQKSYKKELCISEPLCLINRYNRYSFQSDYK